jgi:hypothetical protein
VTSTEQVSALARKRASAECEAPGGACPVAVIEPAISQSPPTRVVADPVRIERMLRTVFKNELDIAKWESMAKSDRRYARLPGEPRPRWVKASEFAEPLLIAARRVRDRHIEDVRHTIDLALTSLYDDETCPDCKPWTMSLPPLEFIREAASAEPPPGSTAMCKTCKGEGLVRKQKTGPEAKKAHKRISYFKKVLDTTALCAKIRYGTSDASAAYTQLEQQNEKLFKFGRESQTSLEGEDAIQGVRKGILDAAVRFDPTRPECADFGTVAYNWAYRNSRHRRPGEKRAGVYAPSIEGIAAGSPQADSQSVQSSITASSGAFGTYSAEHSDQTLVLDMREQVAALPADQRAVIASIIGGQMSFSKTGAPRIKMGAIAEELGMTKAQVRRLSEAAFKTLRGSLSGYVDVVRD